MPVSGFGTARPGSFTFNRLRPFKHLFRLRRAEVLRLLGGGRFEIGFESGFELDGERFEFLPVSCAAAFAEGDDVLHDLTEEADLREVVRGLGDELGVGGLVDRRDSSSALEARVYSVVRDLLDAGRDFVGEEAGRPGFSE